MCSGTFVGRCVYDVLDAKFNFRLTLGAMFKELIGPLQASLDQSKAACSCPAGGPDSFCAGRNCFLAQKKKEGGRSLF